MIIRLKTPEIMIGAYVANMRVIQNYKQNYDQGPHTIKNLWSYHIEGALGEMAVAKHLNLYWSGNIGDREAPDVGPYQVKCNTSRTHDDLILRKTDKKGIYIGVLCFTPEFEICGWIDSADAKIDTYWRAPVKERPAWFFPRDLLNPMDTLPELPWP
jgi:hypothetical protein